MDVDRYRIVHYRYKAWAIEKYFPENKNNKWQPIKYPGNLEQAIHGLIDLNIPMQGYENIDELINDLRKAKEAILESTPDTLYTGRRDA